jgi:hypothetical protein
MLRRSLVQHPCWDGEGLRVAEHALDWMQDEAKLVMHEESACDPESLTHARMEAVSNYDFGVTSLVGSMSDLRSRP